MKEIIFLGQNTSWLEIFAMLTGIFGVCLTVKESILCFPVGIINVSLYAWLFFTPGIRLYADALLQCFYILLLFYGWLKWSKKNDHSEIIHPVRINLKTALQLILICIFATFLLYGFLIRFTDASFPLLDSSLTCASLTAQWMVARKLIENWIIWIIVDLIYLPLYFVKHLPLTAILYAIFIVLAFIGYYDWKNKIATYAE